jgi:SAM-dependent methyltransferase
MTEQNFSTSHSKHNRTREKLAASFREALETAYFKANLWRYHRKIRKKLKPSDSRFDAYLFEQLEHTLTKKRLFGRRKTSSVPFIDIVDRQVGLKDKAVLCIGARNEDEINCFRAKGVAKVVGIDLYSDHPAILVMDMHDLKFADHSFDVVYSRHSFEHAYDKRKAAAEFARVVRTSGVVAIEVPGRFKGGADVNLFGDVGDVKAPFEGFISSVIYEEYSKKEDNTHKMDILRLIMRIS